MQFVIVLAILALVVFFVTTPIRRGWSPAHAADERADDADERRAEQEVEQEFEELDAAREAKYREIRDADLDHRTGKLSDADFGAIDSTLRAEAIEILKALDDVRERQQAAGRARTSGGGE
jgi:Na+-transporting methylmalonyl-CoA/oxaloacetate decarboxylase gamma subunit